MKILIVDDEPVSREVLRKIVAGLDSHQVVAVADANSAWALLDDASRYFDVAFIDLNMPEVDGFELIRRIQQAPLLASMNVVICSSNSDRANLTKAIELGVRHFLVKPCSAESVQAKLNQIRLPDPLMERRIAAGR